MNPGELRTKIKILKYENLENIYKFTNIKTINTKVEIDSKGNAFSNGNVFSKFGMRSNESFTITLRYLKDLTKSNAIKLNDEHYLISYIEDIENRHRYLKLTAVKQKIYICEAFRNATLKDELNRPQHILKNIYKFEGYLLEKYIGFNAETISSNTKHTLILMCPKVINLKPGDIVKVDNNKYTVEIDHTLDEYFNEYEITLSKDV